MYDVGNSLSICGRTRATAIYPIVHMCEFVGNSIGLVVSLVPDPGEQSMVVPHNVAACRGPTVGTDYNASVELDGHN